MSSDCHRLLPLLLLPQVEWSHLDIAGPVWQDKQGGATGFGAQLLAEWAVAQGR
jgi:leucyl aminopeptidase